MKAISKYFKEKEPKLWGTKKGRGFLMKQLYVSLYKDISGKGYGKVLSEVKDWLPMTQKTLQHNTAVVRQCLAEWGRTQRVLGDQSSWEKASRNADFEMGFEDVTLFLDSTDLPKSGKQSVSRKSDEWSYKENSPAQRYMAQMDAKGRIIRLWGGYSPKTYDGHFLQVQKAWFEESLRGAVIAADCHFFWGKDNIDGVTFHIPFPDKKYKSKENPTMKGFSKLTKEQVGYNARLKKVRARVECPFGQMRTMFKSLHSCWREGDEQQNLLVDVAVGIHNYQIK